MQGQPCGPELDETTAQRVEGNSVLADRVTCNPVRGGATFPRGIGGVIAPMPVGPFVPESKTGVPKIAERGAPGSHPSLIQSTDGPALRAPLGFHLPHTPGESRGNEEARVRSGHRFAATPPSYPVTSHPLTVIPVGAQRRAGIQARWE